MLASVTEDDGEAWALVQEKLREKSRKLSSRRSAMLADQKARRESGEAYRGDGPLSSEEEEEDWLSELEELALEAATRSTGEGTESSGQGRYAWGTWVDTDKLKAVTEKLNSAKLRADEKWWTKFLEGQSSRSARVIQGEYYDATLRVFDATSKEYYRFPVGSLVLLKPLYGSVSFQKWRGTSPSSSALGRERKLNGASQTTSETEPVFRVLGGPTHSLSSSSRAALLEVTIRPPTGDEGSVEDDRRPDENAAERVDLARLALLAREEVDEQKKENLASATAASLAGNVGGLESQLEAIVRRVLASRADPDAARRLGVSHVRGVLLSGPPGCGKTLLARHLARSLGAREPQIVNGPEILDKFVGEAERKVRDLFAPAEAEFAAVGDRSALHVVVLDEMDAIARSRGSLTGDTTGVRDGVVNTLLAKMDGVSEAPNVLVIGLTNRPELIDEALKRPGRLEVQVTVDRPDRRGRRDILRIHTRQMRDNDALSEDAIALVDSVDEDSLAARTQDFSGAELAGLVRSAASFALGRAAHDGRTAAVSQDDLEHALSELRAAAATRSDAIAARYHPYGIRGTHTSHLFEEIRSFLTTRKATIQSRLLVPEASGSGSTAAAARAAVSAKEEEIVDYADFVDGADSRLRDVGGLESIFRDQDDRGHALLVIDDVDLVAQDATAATTLRALLRRPPPSHKNSTRLSIVATSSVPDPPSSIVNAFDAVLTVPCVESSQDAVDVLAPLTSAKDELSEKMSLSLTKKVGCKKLITAAERASSSTQLDLDAFFRYLNGP